MNSVERLDQAISTILGQGMADALFSGGTGRTLMHDMACLKAFRDNTSGPDIDVLRSMTLELRKHGQYLNLLWVEPEPTEHGVVINDKDDDNLVVYVNGRVVAQANHDEDGSYVIDAIRNMAKETAAAMGLPLSHTHGDMDTEPSASPQP